MARLSKKFDVRIHEMSHYADPDEEWVAASFDTFDRAREYARRWTRRSLEELRSKAASNAHLKKLWFGFGDDAYVIGDTQVYHGAEEIDFFIEHRATPREIDFEAIEEQK